MELNETQKSVVDILYKEYKSDTVTRSQINDLVKSKKIANPSWLKSDKYKVDRGIYKLPMENNQVETKKVETKQSESQAAYVVSYLLTMLFRKKTKTLYLSVTLLMLRM